MAIRSSFLIIAIVANLLTAPVAWAQKVCENPNSCAKLGCVKTCQDRWEHGVCVGGYCPKGLTTQDKNASGKNSDVELHLYNVSPALELEIRKLIDKGL
jgi:hypothetical protein